MPVAKKGKPPDLRAAAQRYGCKALDVALTLAEDPAVPGAVRVQALLVIARLVGDVEPAHVKADTEREKAKALEPGEDVFTLFAEPEE